MKSFAQSGAAEMSKLYLAGKMPFAPLPPRPLVPPPSTLLQSRCRVLRLRLRFRKIGAKADAAVVWSASPLKRRARAITKRGSFARRWMRLACTALPREASSGVSGWEKIAARELQSWGTPMWPTAALPEFRASARKPNPISATSNAYWGRNACFMAILSTMPPCGHEPHDIAFFAHFLQSREAGVNGCQAS